MLTAAAVSRAQQAQRPACEQYKMRVVTPDSQLDKSMQIQPRTDVDYKGIVINPCRPATVHTDVPAKVQSTREWMPSAIPAQPKSKDLFSPGEMFRQAQQRTAKPQTP
jgi:hypothetical protein